MVEFIKVNGNKEKCMEKVFIQILQDKKQSNFMIKE